ncbi:hypothetical protein NPIL_527401 [Nephila pilipes]|uniref:Uncharacterized protein n=1 Tax=Nephila pilipes TaxID=299642 RepID=A0A8X6R410_NEPPI|nr:hypothetical protein NPIL_527401 [Nephila pilipes]
MYSQPLFLSKLSAVTIRERLFTCIPHERTVWTSDIEIVLDLVQGTTSRNMGVLVYNVGISRCSVRKILRESNIHPRYFTLSVVDFDYSYFFYVH